MVESNHRFLLDPPPVQADVQGIANREESKRAQHDKGRREEAPSKLLFSDAGTHRRAIMLREKLHAGRLRPHPDPRQDEAKIRRLLKRSLQEPILAAPLGLEPRTS